MAFVLAPRVRHFPPPPDLVVNYVAAARFFVVFSIRLCVCVSSRWRFAIVVARENSVDNVRYWGEGLEHGWWTPQAFLCESVDEEGVADVCVTTYWHAETQRKSYNLW